MIIKKYATMVVYNVKEQLYLETYALGVGLRTSLLQERSRLWFPRNEAFNNAVLRPISFVSKNLTSTEVCYSNIEREVLGIVHGLEKFHHDCFTHEVSVITDHKPLITILKKDVVSLSHRL